MSDIVTAAAAAVEYDSWVRTDDGRTIPQSSADSRIQSMLQMLDLKPGMRVLEIGTGSGYSGALLSKAVGENGYVVSIDIDADLVERASQLHKQANNSNIEVHAADGFAGWAPSAPFDRIVAWTTPDVLPAPWIEQAAAGAVVVSPVKLADVAAANALVRCVVGDTFENSELHPGSFIEMAAEVITELGLPVRYVNASLPVDGAPPWWISAHLLHEQPQETADRLLDEVRLAAPQPEFLPVDTESRLAFNAFVLAQTDSPASLGGPVGWGVGVATSDSIAVVLPDGAGLTAGTSEAFDLLAELVDEWHELGEPRHDRLEPTFTKSKNGWQVRARLRVTTG
ncbi:methyltransferase domain-containing protein [Lentzea sp. BCCO 10_0798]|uniref:Protein-L-isoaspartate O-methyltransferase n=1 Tax=Lentzea kristufekii TaxID=3095430 RepID=A0ABU4TYU0_9PSEU|nr:methyltransferase domain-containing protein [Lentzea sp. BCCO 10_0798]MDX8053483.1 methyltransferase domain-containing protein [Lentzea sp. BCCO 10_0798]